MTCSTFWSHFGLINSFIGYETCHVHPLFPGFLDIRASCEVQEKSWLSSHFHDNWMPAIKPTVLYDRFATKSYCRLWNKNKLRKFVSNIAKLSKQTPWLPISTAATVSCNELAIFDLNDIVIHASYTGIRFILFKPFCFLFSKQATKLNVNNGTSFYNLKYVW